jgi:outer membrane protein assembly factor BamB
MEGDNIESSSVTRRNFITGLSGLGAISLNTGGVSAKQLENKAQYDIGLPLEKQWSFGFTDSQDMGSPTIAPGTITDDTLYVSLQATDYDPAKIVAVDRDSHEQIWEITADADISEPVVADDTLYVTSRSTVQAYSATEKSRSTLWTQNTQFDYIFWPTLVDDSVCFSGYNVEEVETSRGSEYHYRTGGISLYAKDGSRKWTHTGEYMHSPSVFS